MSMDSYNAFNAKQDGTLYEQAFILRCLIRGLHPHPTVGDYLPHDMIVQNQAGRMLRVQIKGTDALQKERKKTDASKRSYAKQGRYRITAMMGSKDRKQPIDCHLVDVLTVYVKAYDTFYNIPCTELTSTCVWLAPHDPTSRGKFEKYMENWDVFK